MKILIAGPSFNENSISSLRAKVKELNEGKHGPFDLLCLIPSDIDLTQSDVEAFGIRTVCFDVSNLFHEVDGVKIQFTFGQPPPTLASSVDILISDCAPENSGIPDPLKTSKLVSSWALLTSPRYHFCGGSSKFFQRAPYRNIKGKPVTRLISLASVGSTEKWIHAINLPKEISLVEPPETTDNPYALKPYQAITAAQLPDFSSVKQSTPESTNQMKKKQRTSKGDYQKKKPSVPPRLDCWFCLASPTCEKHLITHVGEEVYVTLPKGGLKPEHALLVPISHENSFAKFLQTSDGALDETEALLLRIEKAFAKSGFATLLTDRSLTFDKAPQQHAYVEALPVPIQGIEKLEETLKKHAEILGITFEPIGMGLGATTRSNLEEVRKLEEYLFVQLPGGKAFVYKGDGSKFEDPRLRNGMLQFSRGIACELLHSHDKINWKSCVLPKAEETKWAKELQASLKSVTE